MIFYHCIDLNDFVLNLNDLGTILDKGKKKEGQSHIMKKNKELILIPFVKPQFYHIQVKKS